MVNQQRTPIRLSTDFSAETLQARRKWNDLLKKLLRDGNGHLKILYQKTYHSDVEERKRLFQKSKS